MPVLRSQLEPVDETVNDLVLAADDHYWEAYELAVQGRPFAAIYLAGFTVEMLLKTAGFIVDGAGRGDPIGGKLGPAKIYGGLRFPAIRRESYHSLRFWAAFLEHKRVDHGRPLGPALLAELRTRTARASETWWIEMRYRPAAPWAAMARVEVLTLLEDVDWFLKNHIQLWS